MNGLSIGIIKFEIVELQFLVTVDNNVSCHVTFGDFQRWPKGALWFINVGYPVRKKFAQVTQFARLCRILTCLTRKIIQERIYKELRDLLGVIFCRVNEFKRWSFRHTPNHSLLYIWCKISIFREVLGVSQTLIVFSLNGIWFGVRLKQSVPQNIFTASVVGTLSLKCCSSFKNKSQNNWSFLEWKRVGGLGIRRGGKSLCQLVIEVSVVQKWF